MQQEKKKSFIVVGTANSQWTETPEPLFSPVVSFLPLQPDKEISHHDCHMQHFLWSVTSVPGIRRVGFHKCSFKHLHLAGFFFSACSGTKVDQL